MFAPFVPLFSLVLFDLRLMLTSKKTLGAVSLTTILILIFILVNPTRPALRHPSVRQFILGPENGQDR